MPASAIAGLVGTHLTNKANKAISARQMAFQKEMSSTAYQRGMADMKKAGLNPMLAFSKGGASTPQGASIPAQDYAAGAANIANVMANTNKTKAETNVLNETQGSFLGKTMTYFKNLLSSDQSISSIKQKLENATRENNMRAFKRSSKNNKTKKPLRIRITPGNQPNKESWKQYKNRTFK
jgi:hypothetical protein